MPKDLTIRHATVNAIACLSRVPQEESWVLVKACQWELISVMEGDYYFAARDAVNLMNRAPYVVLPTCPTCAMFVDMALDDGERVRATAEQAQDEQDALDDVRQQLLTKIRDHLTLAK